MYRYRITTSPLSRRGYPFRMRTAEAQTLYPSLRGQCRGRATCTFTRADLQPRSRS